MVENEQEVEEILREIRHQVRMENYAIAENKLKNSRADTHSVINGGGSSGKANSSSITMKMNLTVTERAWNRLPPINSYRSGIIARIELWFKRLIKRATHWFTWEQVNFNSATHQSLNELQTFLIAHRQSLNKLQKQTDTLQAITLQLIDQQKETTKMLNDYNNYFLKIESLPEASRALELEYLLKENLKSQEIIKTIYNQTHEQIEQLQNGVSDRFKNSPDENDL